jgi:hypothetical protein
MLDEWALAFALLGGHGLRPRRSQAGLVVHRGDGSTLTARAGPALTLDDARGRRIASERAAAGGDAALVAQILDLLERHPEGESHGSAIEHFPPADELSRAILTVAYASYRPELDALAARGVHAYLEHDGGVLRIFADLSPSLLLDVSVDDAGVPPLGPGPGEWTIYLTGADGDERELRVERGRGRRDDAGALAEAVARALATPPGPGPRTSRRIRPENGRRRP